MKAVFRLKDSRVIGEQAKQEAHYKHFKLMAALAVLLEGIVQLAQRIHRHTVDRFFLPDTLLAVACDEVKQAKVLVKLCQRKTVNPVVVEVL